MLTIRLILSATALALASGSALDPARCGARFLLRRGSIIRTEESRALGARYLTELDVGARRECTTLCCETDLCDVFVYEEKGAGAGAGSCYLFACGSAGDFRCKFAPHGNFTSGLLRIARPLAELQDMQQLDDVQPSPLPKNVALPPHVSANNGMSVANQLKPPVAEPQPPAPAPSTTTTSTVTPTPQRASCSRYQFACRSGNECIAVYNACDGVPQCADHSDEAPELGCPPAMQPSPSTSTTIVPPLPPAQTYRQIDDWPHRLAQAQPPFFIEGESMGETPRIFSHTGGLLQTNNAPPAPPAVWQPQAVDGGWGYAGGWRRPFAAPAQPVNPVMPVIDGYNYDRMVAPAPELAAYGAPAPVGGASHDSPKKAPPTEPPTTTTELTKAPPTKAPTKATLPAVVTSVAGGAASAARHWAADKHDGLSERTPAAVLLLVLGVLMWVGVCAVVGGRLRARRHRRKPLAHDADYLVNGMYL